MKKGNEQPAHTVQEQGVNYDSDPNKLPDNTRAVVSLENEVRYLSKSLKIWKFTNVVWIIAAIVFFVLWLTKPGELQHREHVVTEIFEGEDSAHILPPDTIEVDSTLTLQKAISYLDRNSVWEESEMEKYPDLQGLYNDMNIFDLDKLAGPDYQKLQSSKTFQSVVQNAQASMKKNLNPSETGNKFVTNGKINIHSYLYRINPRTEKGK